MKKLKLATLIAALLLSVAPWLEAADLQITWTTPADKTNVASYRVFWGNTSRGTSQLQSVYPSKADVPGGNTASNFTITGLTAGSTYYVSVKSIGTGGVGESDFSNEASKAIPLPPPTGLTISGVVAQVGKFDAQIAWKTNLAADCRVSYGRTAQILDKTIAGIGTHINHNVRIGGLKRHTIYYYKARSIGSGLSTNSAIKSFRTL